MRETAPCSVSIASRSGRTSFACSGLSGGGCTSYRPCSKGLDVFFFLSLSYGRTCIPHHFSIFFASRRYEKPARGPVFPCRLRRLRRFRSLVGRRLVALRAILLATIALAAALLHGEHHDRRDADEHVDRARSHGIHPHAQKTEEVLLEESDEQPVCAADE